MRIAFYKGTRPGLAGLYSRAVRLWTRSKYSHCEIIFKDGMSASASFLDHGVRFKEIEYDSEHWDFLDIPDAFEDNARAWFEEHDGAAYDIWGNIQFIVSPIAEDNDKWFCSEAVAAALGIQDPWRYDPGKLYPVLEMLSHYYVVPDLLAA